MCRPSGPGGASQARRGPPGRAGLGTLATRPGHDWTMPKKKKKNRPRAAPLDCRAVCSTAHVYRRLSNVAAQDHRAQQCLFVIKHPIMNHRYHLLVLVIEFAGFINFKKICARRSFPTFYLFFGRKSFSDTFSSQYISSFLVTFFSKGVQPLNHNI